MIQFNGYISSSAAKGLRHDGDFYNYSFYDDFYRALCGACWCGRAKKSRLTIIVPRWRLPMQNTLFSKGGCY